jgi:hypothetical protein
MPEPTLPDGVFLAACWSDRRMRWEPVYLFPERTEDEGSYILTGVTMEDPNSGDQVPVAEYRPGRDGTHTPMGPEAMSAAGLREHVPHPDADGNMPTP